MHSHSDILARVVGVLLAVIPLVSPRVAVAAANQQMLDWTKELARAAVHSNKVTWEDSIFYGEFFRKDIAAGGIEKVLEFFSAQDGRTLGYLLTANVQPSGQHNNYYVYATKESFPNGKSFEAILYEDIMKSNGNLMPADVLYMALYLCESDYWLATLTCHNLLKEIAYASRGGYQAILAMKSQYPTNPDYYYVVNPQDVIGKLSQLRPPNTPYQGDLIGPWYHMFGIFFVSGVTSSYEGKFMASVEVVTRWLGLGSTTDPFKEEINIWAAHTGGVLNDIVQNQLFVSIKWADRMSAETLTERINILKSKHRELQAVITEWNKLAQGSVGLSEGANMKIDYLRAYQTALAEDVNLLQTELARR